MQSSTPSHGRLGPRSVHRVLQMDELTCHICEELLDGDSPALASLACVQKGLGGIALDVLWHDVTIKALLWLFPAESRDVNSEGKKILVSQLQPADWKRFDECYASRIRMLRRRRLHEREENIDYENILGHLATRLLPQSPRGMFPNLQGIDWRGSPAYELSNIAFLFQPGTKKCYLSALGPEEGINTEGLTLHQALERPVRGMMVLSKTLRKLELDFSDIISKLPQSLQAASEALLKDCTCLVEVRLMATPTLLQILGQLPSLRNLFLKTCRWSGPSATKADHNTILPFPSLERLDVTVYSFPRAHAVLQNASCFPRHFLEVTSETMPTTSEILDILEATVHPVISRDLVSVFLQVPCYEVNPKATGTYTVTLQDIKPLLLCKNMQEFWFDTGAPLDLQDSDIETIVTSWPNIRSLSLGNDICVPERHVPPQLTLQSLFHLANCPALRLLFITFSITKEALSPIPSPIQPSISPLMDLNVGSTELPSGLAASMALLLARLFPCLKAVDPAYSFDKTLDFDYLGDHDTKWYEVEAGLEVFRSEFHANYWSR